MNSLLELLKLLAIVGSIVTFVVTYYRVTYLVSSCDGDRRALLRMLRDITGKRHYFLHVFGLQRNVVNALDAAHPRGLEIKEHKAVLKGLIKDAEGRAAEQARGRLERAIRELYATPQRMAEIDGDAYVAYITPQLEALEALRREADKVFFAGRAEKLSELNNE